MKIGGYILLFIFTGFGASHEWVVETKEFIVSGTTSVGNFKCSYYPNAVDTLSFTSSQSGLHSLQFTIPVKEFGCGNPMLNRDFRRTLKEKEHPLAYVEIRKIRPYKDRYECEIVLELAGSCNLYKQIPLSLKKKELTGELTLKLSEFDLNPPKKMGGLIQVRDEVTVTLVLKLEKV